MLRLFKIILLQFIFLISPRGLAATNNTNQCIRDLGGILSCQDRNSLGLPTDIQACCDGVRQLAVDSCHCNPAIDQVLGEEGRKIYQLEALCRLKQPLQWASITPFFLRRCEAVKTYDYGCEKSDIAIDGERLSSILKFQDLFQDSSDEKSCLDLPAFQAKIAKTFTTDVNFTVPYGIGTYSGHQNVAEYLGMSFTSMTHGFWLNDTTPDPSKRAMLEVSADGRTWSIGSTSKGSFLRGQLPYDQAYVMQKVQFRACETLASDYTIEPTDGLALFVSRFVQTTDLSQRWGWEDICRYHTQYCANDPRTRQYESEEQCRDYLRSLPLYTSACGPNRPMAGHSLSCKFKHHFMIPANPLLHCAHIGPKGKLDAHQHLKCDDAVECGKDQGQDNWPAVEGIGRDLPDDIRKVFEASNQGSETEPFGCVLPSKDNTHSDHEH